MKGGVLFLTSLFVLVNLTTLNSQTITFEKTYPIRPIVKSFSLLETENNSYMIGGYVDESSINYLMVTRVNFAGAIEWTKNFETANISKALIDPLHKTQDGNFFAVTTTLQDDTPGITLIKMDTYGDTLWTKYYPGERPEYGTDLALTNDGGFLVIGGYKESSAVFKKYRLIKTDSLGNEEWSKEEFIENYRPNSLQPGLSITKITDSLFIIGSNRSVCGINEEGGILWSRELSYDLNTVEKSSNESIVLAGRNIIEQINSAGESLLIKEVEGTITTITSLTDGGYIAGLLIGSLMKLDENFDYLWESGITGEVYNIIQSDNQIVGVGNKLPLLYMVKTDEDGNYKMLNLRIPEGGETLSHNYNFNITWISKDVRAVDLHYSTDKGNNWTEIVSDLKETNNNYDWDIPAIEKDSCLLKIRDSELNDLADLSNDYFSITEFFRYGNGSEPGNDSYEYIGINDILMWIGNNGDGSYNPYNDGSGFMWPYGLNAKVGSVFGDGLIYGGIVNGEIRVNGNTHRQGLQAGYIKENGEASDTEEAVNKVWKIRNDWQSLPEGPWKDQYEYDYNNWPGDYGAPFEDVDHDGVFTKGIDLPQFIGDEVLFYVANDLDPDRTNFTFGTDPIGLEFQTTVWGYNNEDFLKDVVFKKYKIINKGNDTIEDMYLSYWMDTDLGSANDDYSGCDTLLNLGYAYNGDDHDESDYYYNDRTKLFHLRAGYGTPPPAVGHMMIQGPIVPDSSSDSAKFGDGHITGYKNLPITAFSFYTCGSPEPYDCPGYGTIGTAQNIYNDMQGRDGSGNFYINPLTGEQTTFCVTGDPVEGTGWYCGEGWPNGPAPQDMYYLMSSGPFTMAPRDTQEVVYAIFMAKGSDNIQSVAELKETARKIHEFWGNDIPTDIKSLDHSKEMPLKFHLAQNYPNPFNPVTTIEYSIPLDSWQSTVGSRQKTEFRRQNQTSSNQHQESRTKNQASIYQHPVSSIQNQSFNLSRRSYTKPDQTNNQSLVQLKVYDVLGREVATLVNAKQKPGTYEVRFDGSNLASGVYFYKLQTSNYVKSRKMVLLK